MRRSPHGLDLVIQYVDAEATVGALEWTPAQIKIERLIKEITTLTKVNKVKAATQSSKATATKGKKLMIEVHGDSDDDGDYRLPKRTRDEPDSPSILYDKGGNEIIEDTELGEDLKEKRKRKKLRTAAVSPKKPRAGQKQKKAAKKSQIQVGEKNAKVVTLEDSGEESDGKTALRDVEEVEARQGAQRGPENKSLSYFHDPTPVKMQNGEKKWLFHCRYCTCTRRVNRTIFGQDPQFDDEPTLPKLNNLASHVTECSKKRKAADSASAAGENSDSPEKPASKLRFKESAELMRKFLKDGELNPEIIPTQKGFLRLFSAWILDESLPWTIGEAPSLAILFKYLRTKFYLPSDTTVRNQLAQIFAELHGKVVCEMTSIKSKIAYATDTWTTRQMVFSFAGTIAQYINDDWELVERIVDFKPLEDKEHEGEHGGLAFFNVIVNTASHYLRTRYGIEPTPDVHIRCTAHVINLVVQAFLFALDEAPDPDDNDQYADIQDYPIHYNVEQDEVQEALEAEEFDEDLDRDLDSDDANLEEEDAQDMSGKSAIKKLHFIVTKITSSPQRRAKFRKIARAKYGHDRRAGLMVIKDILTRWNYTHAMIHRGHLIQDAMDTWVFDTPSFRSVMLSKADWKFLEQIADVLEEFTKATHTMSISGTPTLPFVLPLFTSLERHLQRQADNKDHPYSIRSGAKAALQKLKKYFNIATGNQFYILATVLHPNLRTQWFANAVSKADAAGQKNAIEKAEALLQHVAQTYHEVQPQPSKEMASDVQATPQCSGDGSGDILGDICNVDVLDFSTVTMDQEMLEDEIR
ncbi:hypothetical protein NLJ89_g2755 [Agrocybe chaxingu]|uniref:Uncharacterized protein n=1 Tax=Agrocybe chaxingu TaxID=84603 RepID=A0A9W8KAS6_9AGAR|nr:hypothetical protein NLJ89_g2755 [Agrocybe chaxingu]